MIVCGNFTITIPGLSVGLESVFSPDENDTTEEFKAKLSEMIVESTNVCKYDLRAFCCLLSSPVILEHKAWGGAYCIQHHFCRVITYGDDSHVYYF